MTSYSEKVKHEKRRQNMALLRKLCVGMVCLILLAVAANTYVRQDSEIERLKREAIALDREVSILEAQAYDLEEQEAQANSDEFLERVARDKLGLVKPGELIFID